MGVKSYNPRAIPDFRVGQKVRIAQIDKNEDAERKRKIPFKGEVVDITKFNVVIKSENNIRESFKFVDFLTGDVRLLD
jgi:hypothetical protein